jgi:hypothetical protein
LPLASLLLQPSINDTAGIDETIQPSNEELVVAVPPSLPTPAEPISVVDQGTVNDSANLVPIVLMRTNADGEQMFIPGLYVPARSESIDLSQLSQAQQRAVRTVLGMEKPPETQTPF